jgi:hypothetical protein
MYATYPKRTFDVTSTFIRYSIATAPTRRDRVGGWHGEQAELHSGRVDQGAGERDACQLGCYCVRTKRFVGTLMETFAGGSAFGASKHDPSSNELIKSVIADFETVEGRAAVQEALRKRFGGAKQGEIVQRSLAHLREARKS